MVKILFVYASRAGKGNYPINLPILISAVRKAGHQAKLFDFSDYKCFQPFDYGTRLGFFKSVKEDSENKLLTSDPFVGFNKLLEEFSPDIVATTCLTTDFNSAYNFIQHARQKHEFVSVFGGIHVITNPQHSIENRAVDIICIGEGENAIVELCNRIDKNENYTDIDGFWVKKGGLIYKNKMMPLTDINSIPYMDLDEIKEYHFYRPFDGKLYKMLNFELSRGCIFNCSYCINITLKRIYSECGKYHREKTIERGIDELKYLVKRYDINFIRFWDEDFTLFKVDYLLAFSKRYQKEIGLPFLIYARPETVTEEKIKILKTMGCKTFAMGIESGDEWIRKHVLNRYISDEELIKKFLLVKKHCIRVSAYNMIGLPYENRDRIFKTIEMNRQCKTDASSVTFLEPYPATPIRKMCEDLGLVKEEYVPEFKINQNGIEPHFVPHGMTKEELMGLFRTFNLYIRLPERDRHLIKMAEQDEAIYNNLIQKLTQE